MERDERHEDFDFPTGVDDAETDEMRVREALRPRTGLVDRAPDVRDARAAVLRHVLRSLEHLKRAQTDVAKAAAAAVNAELPSPGGVLALEAETAVLADVIDRVRSERDALMHLEPTETHG